VQIHLLLLALISALVAFVTLWYLNVSHHVISDKEQAVLLLVGAIFAVIYAVFLTYALVFEASLVLSK
jgi:hypothetical protein